MNDPDEVFKEYIKEENEKEQQKIAAEKADYEAKLRAKEESEGI